MKRSLDIRRGDQGGRYTSRRYTAYTTLAPIDPMILA
jgi:hypothetical protein